MLNASASSIKKFEECRRAWYLDSVLRVPKARPEYLNRGTEFDEAVQRYLSGVPQPDGVPELALRQLAVAKRYLPLPGTAGVDWQVKYRKALLEVTLRGACDIRYLATGQLRIIDMKTTSDRGPNRGAANDRPAYSLTDEYTPGPGGNARPLRDDVQARLYAWFEFIRDPALQSVSLTWIYVNKDAAPKCWTSNAVLTRAEVLEWFRSYVVPILGEMVRYATEVGPGEQFEKVPATLEACGLCWVKEHCNMFEGPNEYSQEDIDNSCDLIQLRIPKQPEEKHTMAFNLDDLNDDPPAAQAAPAALETALAASVTPAAREQVYAALVEEAPPDRPAPTPPVQVAVPPTLGINRGRIVVPDLSDDEPEPAPASAVVVTAPAPVAPATTPRTRRGRRAAAAQNTHAAFAERVVAPPAPATPQAELVEQLATELQAVRDAADSAISRCNTILRKLAEGS